MNSKIINISLSVGMIAMVTIPVGWAVDWNGDPNRFGGEVIVGYGSNPANLTVNGKNDGSAIFRVGVLGGSTFMSINNSGNLGIGTTAPAYKLDVAGKVSFSSDIVATAGGWNASAVVPTLTGDKSVLMWIPERAAFRVGRWYSSSVPPSMPNLHESVIGTHSIAFGPHSKAQGSISIAAAVGNAIGDESISIGRNSNAGGASVLYGVAIGKNSNATNEGSWAMNGATVSGKYAFGYGSKVSATAAGSFVIGEYNIQEGDANTVTNSTPLFTVGNGTSGTQRNNALTVYKDGRVKISKRQGDILMGSFGNPGD